jgi:general nucleoside transport system ATP-binding protein
MATLGPRVAMRGIVKRFGAVLANDHVDLVVGPSEIHALLGENGAGKSTVMQILYGIYQADAGEIWIDGRRVDISDPRQAIKNGIGMVHQEFMLVQAMTVVENIVLGLRDSANPLLDLKAAAARLKALSDAHGLSVDPWARVGDLPIGVQQRVEILKLLYRNAMVLILDEPTAILAPQEKAGLFAILASLRAEGRSVIIVTHKLHEIMASADQVSIMRAGRRVQTLPVNETSEAGLARLMVGREVELRTEKPAIQAGAEVFAVRDVRVRDSHGKWVLQDISFAVRAGEILGIAGVEGNGQSELADALLNLRPIAGGKMLLDGKDITRLSPTARRAAGIGFVPADRRGTGSVATLPISSNAILGDHRRFTKARGHWLDRRAIMEHATRIIERFGVRTPGPALEAGKLSGGNLQKLILGREISRQPKLLVVEQPTRGLDVGAIEAVWQSILQERSRGCAVLMFSAELEEIINLSDRVLVLFEGRIMGILDVKDADFDALGMLMAGGAKTQLEQAAS